MLSVSRWPPSLKLPQASSCRAGLFQECGSLRVNRRDMAGRAPFETSAARVHIYSPTGIFHSYTEYHRIPAPAYFNKILHPSRPLLMKYTRYRRARFHCRGIRDESRPLVHPRIRLVIVLFGWLFSSLRHCGNYVVWDRSP